MSGSERPLVEEILDYAVYAPIGVALTVLEDLPKLVDRGKGALASQIGIARFAGKLALGQLRRTIDDALRPSQPVVMEAEGHEGPLTQDHAVATKRSRTARVRDTTTPKAAPLGPDVADLAIPGYDTLAASQVVSRLGALDADELAAVRSYEEQHRGRRTILARIDQLEHGRHAA